MRLATHIAEKKADTALRLCGIIKEKRYHLNIGEYIYSSESQQIFEEWFKKHETKKKQEEKNNLQWNENQPAAPSILVENLRQNQALKPAKTSTRNNKRPHEEVI